MQGVILAGQFLIAFFVEPEVLGMIRWLEAAFAVFLLATSVGMPAIAFRDTALISSEKLRFELYLRGITLSVVTVLAVLLIVSVAYLFSDFLHSSVRFNLLFLLLAALIPSNIGRIGVAVLQGSNLSKCVWRRLFVYAIIAVIILITLTSGYGVGGWIVGRYIIEVYLACIVVSILYSSSNLNFLKRFKAVLFPMFLSGTTASYAFLVRSIADNTPIILLGSVLGASAQVGWLAFAALALFVPLLLMSAVMQSILPSLVRTNCDYLSFTASLRRLQINLLASSLVGMVPILALAFALKSGHVFPQYKESFIPLLILMFSLPFKAYILSAGSAAVAQKAYALSSIIPIVEILIILIGYFSSHGSSAVDMSYLVLLSCIIALIPSVGIIIYCKNRSLNISTI